MFEKRIPIEQGQALALTDMTSNVAITGWDEPDMLIRLRSGDESDLQIKATESGPELSARTACEIQVPAWLPIAIRQVAGNLAVKALQATLTADQVRGNLALTDVQEAGLVEVYGNLTAVRSSTLRVMGTVYGDASLQSCGHLDLQNVRGNFRAKSLGQARVSRISGNLQVQACEDLLSVERTGGNGLLESIGGSCRLNSVAGNLLAKNLRGGAQVERIGGNLVLNGSLGPGHTYHFRADGNAMLRLDEASGAHLTLKSQGSLVSSLPLTDQARNGDTLTGTLGEGGCEVAVEAGGNLSVRSGEVGGGTELAGEIVRQVEESVRTLDLYTVGRQVSDEMEAAVSRLRVKMEMVNWEQVGLQGQQAIDRAMARMQQNLDHLAEKSARHQEKLERQIDRQTRRKERIERRMDQAPGSWPLSGDDAQSMDLGVKTQGPTTPEPDLEQERLAILRMVEQGQITPEEAEMLLDALS